jgi:4-carboxymuconolactone decarboxylase
MPPKTDSLLHLEEIGTVSPVLSRYTQDTLFGDLWRHPALSPRDRSLLTVAALIARSHTTELSRQLGLALDNGVTAAELSETIAHLAFYSGWGAAMAAVPVTRAVFEARGISPDQLPAAEARLLPQDEEIEAKRVAAVDGLIGSAVPHIAQYLTDVLFADLWLRPGLAPRDRSLVTFAALVAVGQAAQIPFHLNKAMDNGMTQEQAAEAVTHLAFYAGWPNGMTAAGIAKDVFGKRPE